MSKWFSIDVLAGPVTKSTRLTPDWTSSSTTYCTTTLRPTGSISFGWLLVNGRSRVPCPATGAVADLGSQAEVRVAGLLHPCRGLQRTGQLSLVDLVGPRHALLAMVGTVADARSTQSGAGLLA